MENIKENKQTDPMPSTKNAEDAARVNDGSKPDQHEESENREKQKDLQKDPVMGEKSRISDETTI